MPRGRPGKTPVSASDPPTTAAAGLLVHPPREQPFEPGGGEGVTQNHGSESAGERDNVGPG